MSLIISRAALAPVQVRLAPCIITQVASKDDRAAAHEREAHIYFVMRAHENVLVAEEVWPPLIIPQ